MTWVQFLEGERIFLFHSITRPVLGPTNSTVNEYQGFFPLQGESDYLALSSNEFNNAWSCTSALSMPYHGFMMRSRKYSRATTRWVFKNCQLQNEIHFEILTVTFFVALSIMGQNVSSHENIIRSLRLLPELAMSYVILFGSPIKLYVIESENFGNQTNACTTC
jgi:hypothetical protein